jgi:hypothetical protein
MSKIHPECPYSSVPDPTVGVDILLRQAPDEEEDENEDEDNDKKENDGADDDEEDGYSE